MHETAMKWTKERLPTRHPKLCLPLEGDTKQLQITVRTVKKKLFSGTKEVIHGPWGFDLGRYRPYEVISLRCDLTELMGSIKFEVMIQQEGVKQGPITHLKASLSNDSLSGSELSNLSALDHSSDAWDRGSV